MSPRKIVNVLATELFGTFVLSLVFMAMLLRTPFPFFSGATGAIVYGLFITVFGSKIVAHMNPAVTIGLWTARKINTLNGIVYIVLQVVGGYAALRVGEYFMHTTLPKVAAGGFWRVFIAEAVGTFIFTLAIAAALNHTDKQLDLNEKSVLVGFGLFVGVLVASLAGYGFLNPSIAISIKALSWGYALGPILGAIVGFNLYSVIVKGFGSGSQLSVSVAKPASATVAAKKPAVKKAKAKK